MSKQDSTDARGNRAEQVLPAETWWIASNFVRRHPEWAIRFGDHLCYLTLVNPEGETRRIIANPGTIHLFGPDSSHSTIRFPLSTSAPDEAVIAMGHFVGDPLHPRNPASTPRTLAYRLLATVLKSTVNDDGRWEVINEILGDDSGDLIQAGIVPKFLNAAKDARLVHSEGWDLGEPLRHFWVVLRDDEPVAIVSTEGRAYLRSRSFGIRPAYEASGRSMLRLATRLIGDRLP